MHILVLQHASVEHPGIFRQFLKEDGHSWDAVNLDQGDPLPDLKKYDALWVMGGPMDVWEEEKYPWLKDEKSFIRNAVEDLGMPFLGLCLGHQLLAEALGGSVGKARSPEIGVMDVQLTELGATGIFFDGLPERFKSLQWHSAEVLTMPAGAECLATSPDCPVQAMRWNTRAFSMQFHLEVEPETVDNWAEINEYADALTQEMGPDGVKRLRSECAQQMSKFNEMAERVYINWLHTTAKA